MYKIPELNDMKQYWTDDFDEVIAFIFNLQNGPRLWGCMQVYSMLIAENNGKIVRLVIGLLKTRDMMYGLVPCRTYGNSSKCNRPQRC